MSALTFLVLGALCFAVILIVWKLFWPRSVPKVDGGDPWAQHNEQRMPSLESAPQAGDTAVDAAVAAQDMGIRP